MFFDYFDELPPVIDDENQETYYALSSLQKAEDALDDQKETKIPNMNLLKDAYLKKLNVFQYFCAVCGHTVLLTTSQIENSKRRKEDGSYIIPLDKTDNKNSDLILKNNTVPDRKIRIIGQGEKPSSEVRQFYTCKECKVMIYYVRKDQTQIFLLPDAVVIDCKYAKFFEKISQVPDLVTEHISEL